MNKYCRWILTGSLIALLGGNAVAQELLTLEEAIRIGLEKNYDIRIAENDSEILDNNHAFSKYSFLPTVGASAMQNFDILDREQGRNTERGDTVIIADNAKSNQLSASVDLEWTIFDGLGMFITYERLHELKKAGELNLKAEIEGTIATISRAYYQIVLEKERIAVLENTVELSEKRMEIAKAVYEVGRSSKLEYLSAQVDLNADVSMLIAQEELHYNAKVNLNRVLGRIVDTEFEVLEAIEVKGDLALQELEEGLLENNSNLLFLKVNEKIAALETKEVRAERFPKLNLNAGYTYNNRDNQVSYASYDISSGYYYGLSATLNILNGLNISRRIQNSKIQEETTEILYNQQQTELLADLNSTYLAYQNSLRLVTLETENLKLAQESEEIAYDRYKLGVANFLELREAQRNAVEAESRLLDAAYSTKIAEIELLRLSGQLMN